MQEHSFLHVLCLFHCIALHIRRHGCSVRRALCGVFDGGDLVQMPCPSFLRPRIC
jgi:hypothetical protein